MFKNVTTDIFNLNLEKRPHSNRIFQVYFESGVLEYPRIFQYKQQARIFDFFYRMSQTGHITHIN